MGHVYAGCGLVCVVAGVDGGQCCCVGESGIGSLVSDTQDRGAFASRWTRKE